MASVKKIFFLYFISVLLYNQAYATGLKITNCVYQDKNIGKENPIVTAIFTVTWENAWRNAKNHDAAWIFFKLNHANEKRSQRHGILKPGSASFIMSYEQQQVTPSFWIPEDGTGLMIAPSSTYRGNISWRISVDIDLTKARNLNLSETIFASCFGVEMVHIPESEFYVGTSDTTAQKNTAALFTAGTRDVYKISSENEIQIGDNQGLLAYNNANEVIYKGDIRGPVPKAFPKGYQAFYCMKYELKEGQYVNFLNSVSEYFSSNRAHIGGRNYALERGGIYLENEKYKTNTPDRPASFLTFDDGCAFADWACLRPMSELEFEKASRGPVKPKYNEYPWGNDSRHKVSRYFDEKGMLVMASPLSEKDINDSNLEIFGASYYWVMDMNKSLWERCVSIGNPKGRQFAGTHGDGSLSGYYGNADNADWPNSYDGKGGISYRGGGTYEAGMVGSPEGKVSDRSFGAWGDGPATIAYGFRAVRTGAGK